MRGISIRGAAPEADVDQGADWRVAFACFVAVTPLYAGLVYVVSLAIA